MYLLTKKNKAEIYKRDEIFAEILKNNYSDEILTEYKKELLSIFTGSEYTNQVDLGKELRNFLAALTLKANCSGLRIISEVLGNGCFEIKKDAFEYNYADILVRSAKISKDRTVHNKAAIKKGKIIIDIVYKGKTLPKLPIGFCATVAKDRVKITYSEKINGVRSGDSKDFGDYFYDRLSPVNLALITESSQ